MEGVKTRGIYGEVQLRNIIADSLTKDQYLENAPIKPSSNDRVEFAIKMPGQGERVKSYSPLTPNSRSRITLA